MHTTDHTLGSCSLDTLRIPLRNWGPSLCPSRGSSQRLLGCDLAVLLPPLPGPFSPAASSSLPLPRFPGPSQGLSQAASPALTPCSSSVLWVHESPGQERRSSQVPQKSSLHLPLSEPLLPHTWLAVCLVVSPGADQVSVSPQSSCWSPAPQGMAFEGDTGQRGQLLVCRWSPCWVLTWRTEPCKKGHERAISPLRVRTQPEGGRLQTQNLTVLDPDLVSPASGVGGKVSAF